MPLFHYKAASIAGEVLEGEMEASSQDAVIRRLQGQGHIPIRAEEVVAGEATADKGALGTPRWLQGSALLRPRAVSRKDVTVITLELSTLLQAGLALDKALEIMVELAETAPVRQTLTGIHDEVRGGASLSAAMGAQSGVFSRFYLNMVRAGEAGGALDVALARLAEFMERSRDLRESVTSALIYPLILVVLSIVSVVVLLAFVVPRFSEMFQDAGQALPWSTQVVVAIGAFFEHYWWVLGMAVGGVYFYLRRQLREPESRERWDGRLLRLPLAGDLIAKLEAARFTRTLGTLIANGVPLLNATMIAKEIIGNQVMARAIEKVAGNIREGRGLARPLMEVSVFPRLAAHMLKVGEETGNLEAMLLQLAEIYEREVRTAVQRLVALVEPVLILGLGLLIAGIIMSVLVAILSVNELAF